MGFPDMLANFEYYDILITSKAEVKRHCDWLNDNRKNYHLTAVYSFMNNYEGTDYKVSIIMCTRKQVGDAMDKLSP